MGNTNNELKTTAKQLRRLALWDLRLTYRNATIAQDRRLADMALAELKQRGF